MKPNFYQINHRVSILKLQPEVIIPTHQPLNRVIPKFLPELNEFPESHHFSLRCSTRLYSFNCLGHFSSPVCLLIHHSQYL